MFTGVEVASAFATGGALPVVIVKFASETSKKMLPTASIFTRACEVAIAGKVTACVPSFGVPETSDTGNVAPPSVDSRMFTEAVLIGATFGSRDVPRDRLRRPRGEGHRGVRRR